VRLVAVGLSHHRADVGLRGRVALDEPESRCLLQNLAVAGAREAVVVSTCNRTELYLAGPDAANLAALGVRELSELVGVDPRELEPVLYRLADATAALHLNRVAAGLDSLVPGEAQVLGQVRAALSLAVSEGTAGLVVSRAFQRALESGKRARSETAISAGNASVASVAASLADGALGGLAGRSALVIGAGRTSELAALNLMSRGLRRLSVANRTYQSACALAGCSVHTLDDLALEIGRTVALRREEAFAAEAICADAAEEFRAWQAERTVAPAIGRLRASTEALRAAEVERLAAGLDAAERERLERLSRQLVGKLLHRPTTRLRESANGPDSVQYAETALDLFGLADDPE
jgi:glutamyl-tRNA reductase